MKVALAGALSLILLVVCHQELQAQAIFEYGKQLEGIGERRIIMNPKGSERSYERRESGPVERRGEPGGRTPSPSAPSMLLVKEREAFLYARQDRHSTVVTKVSPGAKLITLAQSFERDGIWFMVKTANGALGWVSSSDVGEIANIKK